MAETKQITISYCVTVCNELDELTRLLNFLQQNIGENDEIVVQYDTTGVTPEVLDYLNLMNTMHENHTVVGFPLNNDFATFKNNLKDHSTKDYILQLDADEIPSQHLMDYLSTVLETNPVDIIFVPRINTVEGLTDEHIKKWGWKVDENGWVNFPDYQTRLYRRTEDVQWMNKVHERITGYNTFSNFPAKEEWCLYHHKSIEKQTKQNDYYETL